MPRRIVLFVSFAILILTAPLLAADWPIFRGNALQTGVSAETLPDKLEVLWKFETKDGVEGTAAIADGVVYVGSFDEHLYALDLATGKEKWKYKMGPIKANVGVDGTSVYVGNLDGMFHCVDAVTGKKKWTFETDGEVTSGANFSGDHVLFGSGDEFLYCLNKKDGKLVWKFKVPGGPVNGTPAIVGDRTFAAGCDSTLHILDVAKGTDLASVDLGGQVGATPAIVGNRLYIGTVSTNQILAIDWKKAEIAWKFEAPKGPQPFYASAAVTDKLVISGSQDRRVWAVDIKTGKPVWSFPTERQVKGSPVVVGERVFAPSTDGKLYVLDLAKGTQLTKLDLGSALLASPAVGGGRLVIGTDKGMVYCIGAKN